MLTENLSEAIPTGTTQVILDQEQIVEHNDQLYY